MRLTSRAALIAAVSIPLAVVAPTQASAASAGDVTFAYTVNGSTVTNTITNNSGATQACTTAVTPAPGWVLPPAADVFVDQPFLYTTDAVDPGTVTHTVTDIPDGTYVVWAACGLGTGPTTFWISDYPGLTDYMTRFPDRTVFPVQQKATVVTLPRLEGSGSLADIGAIFGS
ncbi:hypothetical protein BTZ20_3886 [Rhodococcus sp. MTM3W5.2]|uniref:hypothetical protein n=1 Tax=Rhodococcus sp. MTM3W5.2 TaxID=1805827 RepID=UPI0009795338|nr:hypothetical protein [Rhodococcus sp. MTM3W5.2]AQA25041.1 hypothetical protein BTZ20_3886 [Rhodococcus sp. MTM3W5.2]